MFDEPIQPVLEIALPAAAPGTWTPVTATFNTARDALLVQYPVRATPSNYWWRFHAPDLTAGAMLLLLIAGWLSVRRVLSRPQSRERIYCPRCNYDLTDASVPGDSRSSVPCPECGALPEDSRPVNGRPLVHRLLPRLLFFLAFLAGATILWSKSIERRQAGSTSWPLAALDNISWWPIARPFIPPVQNRIFDSYSLSTGKKTSTTTIENDPWSGKLTSDLRYYAYSEFRQESGYKNLALIFDPVTGHTRSYTMGDASTGFSRFHGYTQDEKEAVYSHISLVNPDGTCTARILCISLDTLAVRDVAHISVMPQSMAQGNWQLPSLAAAVCNSPPKWAFMPISGPTAGALSYGTFSPDATTPAAPAGHSQLATTPASPVASGNVLAYYPDGKLILDDLNEITPQTGAVRQLPVATAIPTVMLAAQTLSIYNGPALAKTFNIGPGYSTLMTTPTISPDGRWLLVEVTLANAPPRSSNVRCLVFDLSKVPALPAATPQK